MTSRLPSLEAVRAAMAARAFAAPRPGAFDAAVLICLRPGAGADGEGAEVLLGRRAEREGDPWSGHVSLPGGRVDPEDADAVATALRETVEEAGIDVGAHGRVLGGLDLVHGHVRRARVQPVVAEVPRGLAPVPSHEHRHMWWAPAASLVPAIAPVRELPDPVPAFLVTDDAGEEHVLWGLTYRILTMLGEAVAAQRG